MSKELRALAIVFGVLAGLVVLGIAAVAIALGVAVKRVESEPGDPASMLRTAHEIATFDVPRGYRISRAVDIGISVEATLQRADDGSNFRIDLQGSRVPTNMDSQIGATQVGFAFAERALGCTPTASTTADLTVRGKVERAVTMRCTAKSGRRMRMEYVAFRGNAASAGLTATGYGDDFDERAVRELLSSVK